MQVRVVYDHTEPNWSSRYNRKGRVNGAATYSRDLVKYLVPLIEQQLDCNYVISTCAALDTISDVPEAYIYIQFLHEYKYEDTFDLVERVRAKYRNVLFVTAYKSLHHRLVKRGYYSYHLPMSIDTSLLPKVKPFMREFIYFGNVTDKKTDTYVKMTNAIALTNQNINTMSNGYYNGKKIDQEDVWKAVGQYKYGIGVGRCALEMIAMGMKVIICGAEFGGLITNQEEWKAQRDTNMNGRITTFDRDMTACIENIDLSYSTLDYNVSDVAIIHSKEIVNRVRSIL